MINGVYAPAERGLWRRGATRTTASELAGLVAAGEIAVATRRGDLAGAVRLRDVAADASELGMLAAASPHRGTGVGRALVDFAEESSRARGLRAIRLELLLPRAWRHPGKEALKAWYGRRGPARRGRPHRGRPSAPRAAARHPVRARGLREAAARGRLRPR